MHIHACMQIYTYAHTFMYMHTHTHLHLHINIYPVEHMQSNYMAIKTTFMYNKHNISIFCVINILLYMFK